MLRSSRSDAGSGPLRMTASIQEGVRRACVAAHGVPAKNAGAAGERGGGLAPYR
jgi:hypothetical protein